MIDQTRTVAELVLERPARARVFEELGVDYCCGGKVQLADACAAKGLDAHTVAAMLGALESAGAATTVDWGRVSSEALCDHIVEAHHTYLREELPRLGALAEKVERAQRDDDPRLAEVRSTLAALAAELLGHLEHEEVEVFPALIRAEAEESVDRAELEAAVVHLEAEHAESGAALERLRALTDGYAPPAAACNSWSALLDALETLERDLHEHVHEENNILFPRASALAS